MVLRETGMQLVSYAIEEDYREYLRIAEQAENPFTPPFSMSVDSNKKRREIDEKDDQNCYDEEMDDPSYVRFFENLKEDGKSYLLEYEEDGIPVKIKYEGDLSVNEDCDVEPARKLRSRMFGVERELGKKKADKFKSKKEDNAKSSKKLVSDPCYHVFWQHIKISKHGIVFKFGGHEIWYEEGRKRIVGKNDNEGAFSGVEIIDPDTFYKGTTSGMRRVSLEDEEDNSETEYGDGSTSDTEFLEDEKKKGSVSDLRNSTKFRRKVLTDLRKPYDKQEHDMLLREFLLRRQGKRHLDLRNGRERSYSTMKEGKSYLDHYPVIGRKLAQVEHDKLKCLNLLRGFFLYIQKSEPPFRPWEDEECCAVTPGSAMNRDEDYHHNPGSSKTWHHDFSW